MSNKILFWIGGKQNVVNLINSKISTEVLIDSSRKDALHFSKISEKVILVNKKKINKIFSQFKEYKHQGFAAKISYNGNILLNDFFSTNEANIVALDNLQDIGNIGTIIRTCVAFNIRTILLNKSKLNLNLSLLFKNSAGTFAKIKIIYVSNISKALIEFKKNKFQIVGFSSKTESDLAKHKWFPKNVIIFGSEDKGMERSTINELDKQLLIKLQNDTESLNVAQACSIALYDLNLKI